MSQPQQLLCSHTQARICQENIPNINNLGKKQICSRRTSFQQLLGLVKPEIISSLELQKGSYEIICWHRFFQGSSEERLRVHVLIDGQWR